MDPFGRPSHHHHHHRRDDQPEDYPPPEPNFSNPPPPFYGGDHPHPPPPPSFYGGDQPPPPPPPSFHGGDQPPPQVYHTSHYSDLPPPRRPESFDYSSEAPPPPPRVPAYAPPPPDTTASVHHVSHEVAFTHHHTNDQSPLTVSSNKRSFRIFPKAAPNFSLTIRDGNVILSPSNPSDQYQHWYKDEKYSTKVKDQEGFPAFSLVNKATGEAIKHSIGATHPVRLIPYKSDYLDESVLWSESKEIADGYRAIRMVNNIHLNVDAFHGDKRSGGVHDGTTIVLWEWNKGDNQLWRISPY